MIFKEKLKQIIYELQNLHENTDVCLCKKPIYEEHPLFVCGCFTKNLIEKYDEGLNLAEKVTKIKNWDEKVCKKTTDINPDWIKLCNWYQEKIGWKREYFNPKGDYKPCYMIVKLKVKEDE